jgi:HAD superfamily hydrolase (TIGR01450 family)
MSRTLPELYDALLLDLDGTVYRGSVALPGADQLAEIAARFDVVLRWVTNNASRTPEQVAAHLREVGGVPARAEDVSTSAQAAGLVLAAEVPVDSTVLVIGTDALFAEVAAAGMTAVRTYTPGIAAVVQGMNQQLTWQDLAEACLAINAGAYWIATNVDPSLPTDRGDLPGNGAWVGALRIATGHTPVVAGKPERPLMVAAKESANSRRPLVIGDRLDTDIAGAASIQADSLLVLVGVTKAVEVLAAVPVQRPTYVGLDLTSLLLPAELLKVGPGNAWRISVVGTEITVTSGTEQEQDGLDVLREIAYAWWQLHPNAAVAPTKFIGADHAAIAALTNVGL